MPGNYKNAAFFPGYNILAIYKSGSDRDGGGASRSKKYTQPQLGKKWHSRGKANVINWLGLIFQT